MPRNRSLGSAVALLTLSSAVVFLVLSGCAHTTNENQALCSSSITSCEYRPNEGYRFDPEKAGDRDTLVILTMSGGGIRASALSYGTLMALKELPGLTRGSASLLDEVDLISSVSGGSVTAGWFALNGKEQLGQPNKLQNFLYSGGDAALMLRGLNPITLGRLALTEYQRSDVLSGYFAHILFEDAKYKDIKTFYDSHNGTQPFVMLNATDLGHEIGFAFTQNRFDLICSDLSQYRVADAVAASAEFPIVFSAAGLTNFSNGCKVHGQQDWDLRGPPKWVNYYLDQYDVKATDESAVNVLAIPSNSLLQVRAARDAKEYLAPAPDDRVLHLLDGGLVDNLGIQSVMRLEDTEIARAPGFYQRLHYGSQDQPHLPRYDKIRHVLFIVVNARSRAPTGIDSTVYPPDLFTSLYRVIDTPIDNGIIDTQNYLTAELQATLTGRTIGTFPAEEVVGSGPISQKPDFHIVTLDFEMIPDEKCRKFYWSMGTKWSLPAEEIEGLTALPAVLLRRSPELESYYRDAGKAVVLNRYFGNSQSVAAGFTRDVSKVCSADSK